MSWPLGEMEKRSATVLRPSRRSGRTVYCTWSGPLPGLIRVACSSPRISSHLGQPAFEISPFHLASDEGDGLPVGDGGFRLTPQSAQ